MRRLSLAQIVPLCAVSILAAGILTACAPEPRPQVVTPRPIYSEYGIDNTPYVYGNADSYGFPDPWGQPTAITGGYLGANRFTPQPGLICERSHHVCYDRNGVNDAETTRYLGSREVWNRERLYGSSKVYIPTPQ